MSYHGVIMNHSLLLSLRRTLYDSAGDLSDKKRASACILTGPSFPDNVVIKRGASLFYSPFFLYEHSYFLLGVPNG